MIKKLQIVNQDGKMVDLINEFMLEKDYLSFQWVNENIMVEQDLKVSSGRSRLFKSRQLSPLPATLTCEEWEKIRWIFTQDQERLYLSYSNGVKDFIMYVDDTPSITYKDISNVDLVDIEITFTQLSPLFFKTWHNHLFYNDDRNEGKYDAVYGEFKYAAKLNTIDDNDDIITNLGDTYSPIAIRIPKGGLNPTVIVTDANKKEYTLKLLGDYTGQEILIDMYTMTITADGVDVSQYLDNDYDNWFFVELGNSLINIPNVKDYTVEVLNVRRVP